MKIVAGADAIMTAEGSTEAPKWPGVEVSPGSENRARANGFPRNLGGPVVSVGKDRLGGPEIKPRPRGSELEPAGSKARAQRRYRPRIPKLAGKDGRESECPTVPTRQGNSPREDPVEGEGHRETGPLERKMQETLGSNSVSTKLQQIAELARQNTQMVLTTLVHHIDIEWLREAWRRTRKDGAVGVDGQGAAEYVANLEGNLQSLLDRFKSGKYKAPPVRRVQIPKGDGSKTRPIGIPTLEDKVLQRAVAMVLEAVYEQEFLDCSFGFRPGRSAHQAVDALGGSLMKMHGGWVLDLDIRSFFDSLDRQHLRSFLDQRVRDGVVRRTIDKWLKAGVLDAGTLLRPGAGTPQGGVISPLLANVFLHHVLDVWFEQEVKPRMRGQVTLVRYADDAVLVAQREDDARRILAVLPKRFGRHGLELHPDKTRLVFFVRPDRHTTGKGHHGGRPPGTFDFLGFTMLWGRTRRGSWVVKKRTARERKRRTIRRISAWCRRHRHEPLIEQHRSLSRQLQGHYAYYGVTGNFAALSVVFDHAVRAWHYWLNRRAQRRDLSWPRFKRILARLPLPRPRVVHSIYLSAANP